MEEFVEITAKYQATYIERCFSSMAGLHEFSVAFYKDIGNLYDALTRLKNLGRNPIGFSIDDGPIRPSRAYLEARQGSGPIL